MLTHPKPVITLLSQYKGITQTEITKNYTREFHSILKRLTLLKLTKEVLNSTIVLSIPKEYTFVLVSYAGKIYWKNCKTLLKYFNLIFKFFALPML